MSRRDRRRAETRERIFEAAMRLLTERDFEAVTVEMITDAAEVGKGTFFNYFASKEAVVAYQLDTLLRRLTGQFHLIYTALKADPGSRSEAAIWPQIVAITHLAAERDAGSRRLTRTLLALSLTDPLVREASLRVQQRIIEIGTELIRIGQARGELRADLPAGYLADHLVQTYFQVLYCWAQSDSDESLHHALDRTYALIRDGLCRTEN